MRATLAHYHPTTLAACVCGELFAPLRGHLAGYVCVRASLTELSLKVLADNDVVVVVIAPTEGVQHKYLSGLVCPLPYDLPVAPVEQVEPAAFRALGPHPDFRSHAPPAREGGAKVAGTDT